MRPLDASGLLVVSGLFALWVGLTDVALLYVRPQTKTWLVLAGGVLVAVGVIALVRAFRRRHDADGSQHPLARIGWLLALPFAVAIIIGSNPLGSYAAGRQNGSRTLPQGEFDLEQHLEAGSFAGQSPALRVLDFVRAAQDPESRDLLAETSVALTGFVTEDDTAPDDREFLLTRFTIGCCAADAIAVFVRVTVDEAELPDTDEWVTVRGRLDPTSAAGDGDGDDVPDPPTLVADDIRSADQPAEVYEYPP